MIETVIGGGAGAGRDVRTTDPSIVSGEIRFRFSPDGAFGGAVPDDDDAVDICQSTRRRAHEA